MRPNIQGFSTTADLLADHQVPEVDKPIFHEFQYYGNYLAEQLNDQPHVTLYMKLAKETDRVLLEQALDFVRGASRVKNRVGLFMWKLEKLKKTNLR